MDRAVPFAYYFPLKRTGMHYHVVVFLKCIEQSNWHLQPVVGKPRIGQIESQVNMINVSIINHLHELEMDIDSLQLSKGERALLEVVNRETVWQNSADKPGTSHKNPVAEQTGEF